MTTPSQPPISMENVRAELGASYPLSLNQPSVLELAGKSSAPISLLDLLGKSHIVKNSMFCEYQPYQEGFVIGYSDGSSDSFLAPLANQLLGSLPGGKISGYPVNYLTTSLSSNEGVSTYDTRIALDLSLGNFNGWYVRVYNESGVLTGTAQMLVEGSPLGGKQVYSSSNAILNPYGGQTVSVTFSPS